jgi:glutaminyl-peptide cyclotransferase
VTNDVSKRRGLRFAARTSPARASTSDERPANKRPKLLPAAAIAVVLSACVPAAQQKPPSPKFDGRRAFKDLEQIVALGPRPAGTLALAKTRAYITAQLEAAGLKVQEQAFDAATPLGTTRMVNLRATIAGTGSGPTLLITGHYDTKLFKDAVFVGANDAGSSTAFLIELARVLAKQPAGVPIELVFFDGEEAVVEWQGDDNTYGSRHYVRAAQRDGSVKQIGAMILVDMVGERNPRFLRESQSTPWLTDIIWRRARALGRKEFVDDSTPIADDHVPFIEAGVPAVDIIDLDYPAWHTPQDTLDKLSPDSLQAVGDVLLAALPEIVERISKR